MLNSSLTTSELITELRSISQPVIKNVEDLKALSYFQVMSLLGNVSLHTGGIENTAKLISLSGIDGKSKILEIGSGTGVTTSSLLGLGLDVTIVEPSTPLLCTTLNNSYRKSKVLPEFYNLPIECADDLRSNFYDLVILECVFGFIKNKKTAVLQIERVLKQKGKVIITDFFYHTPPNSATKRFINTELDIDSFLMESEFKDFFKGFVFNNWEIIKIKNHEITDNQISDILKNNVQYGIFPFDEEGARIIAEKLQFWERGFSENRKFLKAFNAVLEKTSNVSKFPLSLKSERLMLRVIKQEDYEDLHQAIKKSYKELKPWVEWSPDYMLDEKNCEAWCSQAHCKSLRNEELHMLILERGTMKLVGLVGLHNVNWHDSSFHIGYWCVTDFAGNGYITEAVKILTNYLLKVVRGGKIFITTDNENTKSWKLAERAGFRLEKVIEKERLNAHGKWRSTRIYSIQEP